MLYNLLILLVAFILASCSGQGVKYPAPSALKATEVNPVHKPGKKEAVKSRSVVVSARPAFRSTKEAIKFYSLNDSVDSRICLSIYYLKAGKIYKAKKIVSSLEKRNLSFEKYSKVYAIAGLIKFKKRRNYKDYFELAYAYDSKNSLAKYMLSSRLKSFKTALKIAEKWCQR